MENELELSIFNSEYSPTIQLYLHGHTKLANIKAEHNHSYKLVPFLAEDTVGKLFIFPNEEECNIFYPIEVIKTDDGAAQPNEAA